MEILELVIQLSKLVGGVAIVAVLYALWRQQDRMLKELQKWKEHDLQHHLKDDQALRDLMHTESRKNDTIIDLLKIILSEAEKC